MHTTHLEHQVVIPLSKMKLFLLLLLSIAFIVTGVLFILYPDVIASSRRDPMYISVIGYVCVVFFGLCFVAIGSRMFSKKQGLVIDKHGMTDNSSASSAGLIAWSDIESIRVLKIYNQKMILLKVSNPMDYINRQTSRFKRKGMEMNYKMYGSPLIIATNSLKISHKELLERLTACLNESR